MKKKLEKLVSCIACGMSRCTLDPGDDQSISLYATEAVDKLKDLRSETSLNITLSDRNSMILNGMQISLSSPTSKKFFLKLRQKGIEKIVIGKGVQPDELKSFFADLASSGNAVRSYKHIIVTYPGEQMIDAALTAAPSLKDELPHVKRIFRDIALYKSIPMPSVDAVVGNLIRHIRNKTDVISMLIPHSFDSDDLFAHAANVALLSVYQGESIGFGSSLLHDIGLAAILHDIGKTILPRQLLEKRFALNDEEWQIMKKHPEYGAALLSSLMKVPDIAIVVALEHHMQYDGMGYPPRKTGSKKQHVVSQIIAISDFCTALNADLQHRQSLTPNEILTLLVECAGKEFNPYLVENYVCSMRGSCPTGAGLSDPENHV